MSFYIGQNVEFTYPGTLYSHCGKVKGISQDSKTLYVQLHAYDIETYRILRSVPAACASPEEDEQHEQY